MVECELPKLNMRVRFPLPAPKFSFNYPLSPVLSLKLVTKKQYYSK